MGRTWAAASAVVLAVLAGAGPAGAAGGRLAPVRERYEPGEVATLVGYTGGPAPETAFYAYLRTAGTVPRSRLLDSDWYVGELAVEQTGHPGYQALRVTLRFEVPADIAPGQYEVVYCDDPCTGEPLGDLVTSPLSVGVDPVRPVVREWPADEPEIGSLARDAVLVGAPPTTVAAAPPVTVVVPAPAPPPEPQHDEDGDMAWPLPTVLVLAAAAGTAAVLSRPRVLRPPSTVAGARRTDPAAAGRG